MQALRVFSHLLRPRHWAMLPVGIALCLVASGAAYCAPAQASSLVATSTSDQTMDCSVPAAPGLLNLGSATPAQAASLDDLEQTAVQNTVSDHDLTCSDVPAILGWGQYSADAELWGLLVQAAQTPASSQTADQRNAVAWLTSLQQAQDEQAADDAGMEYAKWAGLGVSQYQSVLDADIANNFQLTYNPYESGPPADPLLTFLSQTPEPYWNGENQNTPAVQWYNEGYCAYQSPSNAPNPYVDNLYNADTVPQQCVTACTNLLGCTPPTPTLGDFQGWGTWDADETFESETFADTAHAIAVGAEFGGAVAGAVGAGVSISATLGTSLSGTALQTAIFPYAAQAFYVSRVQAAQLGIEEGVTDEAADAAAESAGVMTASSIGFIVGVVIFAAVTAALEGISVFDAANLPGQLASNIESAYTQPPDVASLITTTTGAQGLFALFANATTSPSLSTVPGPANADPVFAVQEQGSTSTTYSNSITWVDSSADGSSTSSSGSSSSSSSATPSTDSARVSGTTWFVEQLGLGTTDATTVQTLTIHYSDWTGAGQTAWLLDTPSGYSFVGIADTIQQAQGFDPSTCLADNLCWTSPSIDFVGTDGNDYSASVEAPGAPPAVTVTAPTETLEGVPQIYSATGSAPDGLPLTYQWQFQQAESGVIVSVCLTGPSCPISYSTVLDGQQVTYAWPTSGTWSVQVTATDSLGKTGTYSFTVDVRDVGPQVVLSPDCPNGSSSANCDKHSVNLGTATSLTGLVHHAGANDMETVKVNWGDGASDSAFVADGGNSRADNLQVTSASSTVIDVSDQHTYAKPGNYKGTVTATDQAGGTTSQQFLEQVIGSQTINLPRLPARVPYGFGPEKLEVTGGASGQQIGVQATPSKVCQLSGLTRGTASSGIATASANLVISGIGTCTVTATQTGSNDYTKAAEVTRAFSVVPVPLQVIPDGASMTFGSTVPKIVVTYNGFVNGNNSNSLSSRPTCVATDAGQPVNSTTPPGNYPIACSGAKDGNYQFSYGAAQLHVKTTTLKVTANNQTMSYGSAVPAFTATYQGFVNDNTSSVVSGLRCSAEKANYLPISAKPAPGTYKITCQGAAVPTGYVVSYVPGTLTVNADNNP